MATSAVAHHKARVASIARTIRAGERPPNDPEFVTAKRDLNTANLEAAVLKCLAKAPIPTDAHLQRIAALLMAGSRASPPSPSPRPASGGTTPPSENARRAAVAERIAELDGGDAA